MAGNMAVFSPQDIKMITKLSESPSVGQVNEKNLFLQLDFYGLCTYRKGIALELTAVCYFTALTYLVHTLGSIDMNLLLLKLYIGACNYAIAGKDSTTRCP